MAEGLDKCDVGDFQGLEERVSSESDTQQVRHGEQITALRILKWRRNHAAGNTPPTEISVLAQGDTDYDQIEFDTVQST